MMDVVKNIWAPILGSLQAKKQIKVLNVSIWKVL